MTFRRQIPALLWLARHWQRPPWSEDAADVLTKLEIADVPTMWGMEGVGGGSDGG